GDAVCAAKYFNSVANRDSVLRGYALWHLSQIARSSGNLLAERLQLMELSAAAPDSLLADAVKRRMARSWFESKNYDLAIKSLTQGTKTSGSKAVPEREDRLLLGRAYLFSGNTEAARGIFNELITSLANPAQPDDFALEAVKGLDLIEVGSDKFGKAVPPLSDYEHLRRAQIYQFNRDFSDARLHFSAIINNHPDSGIVPDAIYQIGRGYSQIADFTDAVKWYERIGEQHADHPVNKDALLQLASAYTLLGKHHEAIGRYEKYIQKFPDDERIDRPYLNIIDVYRDLGEEAEALKWAAKAQEVFRGKTGEAQALFVQARIHLARSLWNETLADLDKLKELKNLGGANVPGGTSIAEVTFLRGYILEQLRRYPEAIDAYLSIPDGRNEYYGWRSTERLLVLNNVPEARPHIENAIRVELQIADAQVLKNIVERKRRADEMRIAAQRIKRLTADPSILKQTEGIILNAYYGSLPDYYYARSIGLSDNTRQCHFPEPDGVGSRSDGWEKKYYGRCTWRMAGDSYRPKRDRRFPIIEELIFLGLYDEVAPELAIALGVDKPSAKLSKEDSTSLIRAYLRGDRADKAVDYIEMLWRKVPADYLMEMAPRDVVEMLYPAPYADALLKYAPSRNVDPRFLLAIMRQESRFRPNVKSYAAARGLMQFISTTSDKIAVELGRTNFDQDELYYPPTAILFGSQYVGSLFKLFPDKPDAVAASYNGGEDNMKRWYNRSKTDVPERYVPEIAFAQSKDYVHRVMTNYRMYQLLYDEKLNRK
ncbi:MAG TPA: transglycosylase SLT domain-containing protein, partial [Pyrinomonadaceae bacterium]|nr:transglycosylase SLT domain-containing protein [Pyrinomonadaceae bacterium]